MGYLSIGHHKLDFYFLSQVCVKRHETPETVSSLVHSVLVGDRTEAFGCPLSAVM
jgi:hypothetical protein